jgi:putative restriction endonuclease
MAYEQKCAFTRETCIDVSQAAHIQPYVNERSNHVQNGLALRMDIYALFDAGQLTVDKDYRIRVNPFLESVTYRELDGNMISLPSKLQYHPCTEALQYHYVNVFRR